MPRTMRRIQSNNQLSNKPECGCNPIIRFQMHLIVLQLMLISALACKPYTTAEFVKGSLSIASEHPVENYALQAELRIGPNKKRWWVVCVTTKFHGISNGSVNKTAAGVTPSTAQTEIDFKSECKHNANSSGHIAHVRMCLRSERE